MCGVFATVNTLAHNATRPTLLTAALSLGLCGLAATATAAVLARRGAGRTFSLHPPQ